MRGAMCRLSHKDLVEVGTIIGWRSISQNARSIHLINFGGHGIYGCGYGYGLPVYGEDTVTLREFINYGYQVVILGYGLEEFSRKLLKALPYVICDIDTYSVS